MLDPELDRRTTNILSEYQTRLQLFIYFSLFEFKLSYFLHFLIGVSKLYPVNQWAESLKNRITDCNCLFTARRSYNQRTTNDKIFAVENPCTRWSRDVFPLTYDLKVKPTYNWAELVLKPIRDVYIYTDYMNGWTTQARLPSGTDTYYTYNICRQSDNGRRKHLRIVPLKYMHFFNAIKW